MLAVTARNLTVPTRLVLNVGVVCAVIVTVLDVLLRPLPSNFTLNWEDSPGLSGSLLQSLGTVQPHVLLIL